MIGITEFIEIAKISRAIVVVRGQRVILDRNLASLYGVTTKRLNEQVNRNAARFPEDFVFRLALLSESKWLEVRVCKSVQSTDQTDRIRRTVRWPDRSL
jgi:hypothetical protein